MRFVHSADWQIGKPFKRFGEKEGVLRQARLNAIESIGRLAVAQGAQDVLVAGDIYDTDSPTQKSLLEPLERMRSFPKIAWHLLPGNHDPHRPKGVWDRLLEQGLPGNVRPNLTADPVVLSDGAVLLPAPLTRKSEGADLTEWMDRAQTPPGAIRVGLAHGSVVGFGTDGEATNPIDPRRAEIAGLSYLALGDWHRTMQVNSSTWYAGTPEPDRAGSQESGQALLVEIDGPNAPANVSSHVVGAFHWRTREETLSDIADLPDLETRLRALPDLSSTILRLRLKGAVPLVGRAELDIMLAGLSAAMFSLEADTSALVARPTEQDLESIDFGGVLRHAADRLKAMADSSDTAADKRRAENALVHLFVMATAKGA
jgi:DNA repair exonuclease SbcCD nuclease subunit